MSMFTTAFRDDILALIRGANHWIGLEAAVSNFRTPTATEASYTGYARVAIAATTGWNAPADTAATPSGRRISNAATVTFPQNTGTAQDVVAWSVWTASTGGSRRITVALDDDPPIVGTAATSDTITAYGHGLVADQRVFVMAFPGALLPTGLAEGTAYFVRATGLTADTFTLATTSGGAAVDITANGAAMFIPYKTTTITTNFTPQFAAAALEIAA
jgi:hypothetical protein